VRILHDENGLHEVDKDSQESGYYNSDPMIFFLSNSQGYGVLDFNGEDEEDEGIIELVQK